jgi:hypothetical protein
MRLLISGEAIVIRSIRQMIKAFNEADRQLRDQGYIVVHGGMIACVVPLCNIEPQARKKRRYRVWGTASAALAQ